MLHGRAAECALLDELLAGVRAGAGGAVVLRGDPGIGKTALLDYAQERAGGLAVLRATGLEAESELPFATLHQLLRPVLGVLGALPEPQAQALRAALGLAPASGHDRFLVSSAVLSVLAEATAERGLVCLIDDAQWIDQASLDALLFAARRLGDDGVAMLFAARPGGEQRLAAPELRVVRLAGLVADPEAVVREHGAAAPSRAVNDRLAEITGGNPLALGELSAALTADQLAGRAPLPDPLPLTEGLERAFLAQVRRLDPAAQRALLVLATDSTGEAPVVLGALDRLGVPADALHQIEAARLVLIGADGVRVRHPLIRSAVLAGASFTERRDVHQALAAVLDAADDPDRSAWHRAAAAAGPDDAVADELAAVAVRAAERSAHAAAASAYERAAALSTSPATRAERYLASAGAAWLAAQPERARQALAHARPLTADPVVRAQLARLEGIVAWRCGVATDAYRILRDGAELAAPHAAPLALLLLVHATEAAGYIGDVEALVDTCRRAAGIDPGDDAGARLSKDFLDAFPALLIGDTETGTRLLRRVIDAPYGATDPTRLIWAATAAFYVGDVVEAGRLAERATRIARVADMTGSLPYALELQGAAERVQGRYASAVALATEGLDLAREAQQDSSAAVHLSALATIAALRGREDECAAVAGQALALAVPRRLGLAAGSATAALALCDLIQGRYGEALQRYTALAAAGPGGTHPLVNWASLPDHIEAAVRAGDLAAARAALALLERWVTPSTGAGTRASLLRSQALLATGADAEPLYLAALATYRPTETPLERARTHLLYGEWLRRARRRIDAREQLRQAHDAFDTIGAEPLADRARTELRATGETARRRDVTAMAQLTPQEMQIARLVAEGAANREVAARLFLSPRTVEYHLYKIYPKLGVGSRTELSHLLATDPSLSAVAG